MRWQKWLVRILPSEPFTSSETMALGEVKKKRKKRKKVKKEKLKFETGLFEILHLGKSHFAKEGFKTGYTIVS